MSQSNKAVLPLKVGQEVMAEFPETRMSYRARILRNVGEYHVELEDGSVHVLSKSSVRPIVEGGSPAVTRLPGRPRSRRNSASHSPARRSSSRGRLTSSTSRHRSTSRSRTSSKQLSPSRSLKPRSPSRSLKPRSPSRSLKPRSPSRSLKPRSPSRSLKPPSEISATSSGNVTKQSNSVLKQRPTVEIVQAKVAPASRSLMATPTTSFVTSSLSNTCEGLRPRMSARVAALQTARVAGVVAPGLISEGMEEVVSKRILKDGGRDAHKKTFRSESNFFGTFWTFVFTVFCPPFVLSLYLMCNEKSCTVTKLPSFPVRLSSYVDVEAIAIFFGWLIFQGLLYTLPIGRLVEGQLLRDGTRLKYRMNGPFAFFVSMLSVSSILYYYPTAANVVYRKAFVIGVTGIAFSFVLSLLLYMKSRWAPPYRLSLQAKSRNFIYVFFMGNELNPRPLGFELKLFLELRPGVIGWAALNVIYVWKDYVERGGGEVGQVSYPLLLSAALQIFYAADALWFEETLLTTIDVVTEGLGFMLVFGDLVFVPIIFTFQSRFLLEHHRVLPWYALAAIFALFVVGYVIFRASNLQKDAFRKNPYSSAVAHLDTINTGSAKKILAGGWWGWVRHPNYFGDLLLALSLCLPAGFTNLLPYSYFIYLLIILVHRLYRDDSFCRQKYGASWDEYCSRVRYSLIRYVY